MLACPKFILPAVMGGAKRREVRLIVMMKTGWQKSSSYITCHTRTWQSSSAFFSLHHPSRPRVPACQPAYISGTVSPSRSVSSNFTGAPTQQIESEISDLEYETVCNETLDSLTERFDEIGDEDWAGEEYDTNFSDGVLTVKFGRHLGTYVINKQTPNKQIWLSSPKSGPKRYDFKDGVWIYKHDGITLHRLLSEELSEALGRHLDFTQCSYGKS